MPDRELDFYIWRDENANDASGYELDEAEDVAPAVGYPELERESDSRLQQAIASAYAAMIQRTLVAK